MALAARTVLITGASRGLGLELVRQAVKLPSAPEVVIAACRNPDGATALQEMAKSHPSVKVIKLDTQRDEDIENAVKTTSSILGDRGLNLLISNAGINTKGGNCLRTVRRERLNEHYDVNCSASVILVQKFLPLLEKSAAEKDPKEFSCSKSAVVIMSTIMASQELTFQSGFGDTFSYKCSKSAVNMATILMYRELSPLGILVMAVHPGWVKTDMGTDIAPLTPEESISSVLNLLGNANEASQGKLHSYSGELLPY